MVMIGNYRSRAELRKSRRQPFHYSAKIFVDGTTPPVKCTVADVSQSGARLVLEKEDKLPERFMLMLSRNGPTRRRCRVVWRDGVTIGVEFSNY